MIDLLRALFASPEAERDPAAWATRLAAHVGVGCGGWLILLALSPVFATTFVLAAYALWEVEQYQDGRRMAWDGALDWCAVALAVTGMHAVWHQQRWAAVGCGIAMLIVMWAGVEKRR